ncbi:MAG TPA: DapH/DapD/GlmU-related protein [Baekduia sp.]|nr:DapH/DapD/GlmU-related protein [Baekduia sp.]
MAQAQAPGLVLHPEAEVGANVTFGANVVVHAGVEIGDDVTIGDGAVLGKRPSVSGRSEAATTAIFEPLRIGAGATICTQAVVFAGTTIGEGVIIGDQAHVRERCLIGEHTVIGRASGIENDTSIGARCRIQSQVYITAWSVVEDDVFVGPCAMTTNDNRMARHAPGHDLRGATLRRASRIGGGAVLTPGIEVGEEAFVAAGAVVTASVPARAVVMGVPARVVRQVPDEDLLENWQ